MAANTRRFQSMPKGQWAGWLDALIDVMEADDSIAGIQPKICSSEAHNLVWICRCIRWLWDGPGLSFFAGERFFYHVENDNGQYNDECELWVSGAAMVIPHWFVQKIWWLRQTLFCAPGRNRFLLELKRADSAVCGTSRRVAGYHLGGGTHEYDNPRKHSQLRNNPQYAA